MGDKIKLSEILYACLTFKQDPTKEENLNLIQDILGKMQIREYLPLINKELAIITIMNCATDLMDAADSELNIAVGKIFYGLFNYVVNLEIDIEYGTITPGIIDCLYELGVIDYILEHCSKDFNRLETMVSEAINFSNVQKICEIPALMSDDKLNELTESIKSLKTELTPEILDALKSISTETSPEWKALKETVAENIHENVMAKEFKTLDELNEENKIDK